MRDCLLQVRHYINFSVDIHEMPIGTAGPQSGSMNVVVGPSTAIYQIRILRFITSESQTRTPPLEKGGIEITLQPVNHHGHT